MSAAATDRVRPSGWLIVIAVVGFVLGIGGCSTLGVIAAVRALDVDTVVSREGSVELEAGSYTVYLTNTFADVSITAPDGTPVDLDRYGDADVTVTENGRDYEATYTFRAPLDGTYSVVHDGTGEVAIGEGILKNLGPLWVGLALGVVVCTAMTVLFIVTLVKRSSSRNRIRAAQFAAAGWPGQGYPGGPTYPPPATRWGDRPPPPPPPG